MSSPSDNDFKRYHFSTIVNFYYDYDDLKEIVNCKVRVKMRNFRGKSEKLILGQSKNDVKNAVNLVLVQTALQL